MNTKRKLARACVWMIALALFVQLLAPSLITASAETVTVTQSTDVIQDFDAMDTLVNGSNYVQDGDPVVVELISESETDKAIKMTVGEGSGNGNVGFVPSTTDWSNGVGLQMYVKNLSDTAQMVISPRFFCNNNSGATDFWVLNEGQPYVLVSGETVTTSNVAYGVVFLPAGFEGYVRIPFTSFAGGWYGSTPDTMDLAAAGLVYTTFVNNGYSGMSIVMDEISVIKPAQSPVVENFHQWFTPAVAAEPQIGAEMVNNGIHGMSLKISIVSAGTANNLGWTPAVTNWSGSGALQLYVKNLSDSALPFSLRFFANNDVGQTDLWLLDPASAVSIRLIQNDQVSEATANYGFVFVPANFEGYIQIPFSSFVGGWYGSANSTLDLSLVTAMYFFYDTSEAAGYVGKSMLVDDFSLLTALSDVTPEPSEDPTEGQDPTEGEDPTEGQDPTEDDKKEEIPTKPLKDFTAVEKFDAWTDLSKVVYDGDPLTVELIADSASDHALKLTVTGAASGSSNSGMGFTPTNTDWSGKGGLQLYMKNLSNEELAVSVRFIASNGTALDMWMANHEHPITLISGKEVTDSAIFYSFVMLPANFEGYVRIPFEAYAGAWYGSANSTLDLSSITAMYMIYDTNPASTYIGKSMMLDEIALIDSMNDPIPGKGSAGLVMTGKEIEDFDGREDTSGIQADQDPINVEFVKDANGGNALKLTLPKVSTSLTGVGNVGWTPTVTDWSKGDGLKIYMENLTEGDMAVSIRFIDAKHSELWSAAHETPITMTQNGQTSVSKLIYGFVVLPENFKGYVTIPFSAFSGIWHGKTYADLDLSEISAMYASFDTSAASGYNGKSVIIDDISMYTEEAARTGDDFNLAVPVMIMALCVAAVVLMNAKRREDY